MNVKIVKSLLICSAWLLGFARDGFASAGQFFRDGTAAYQSGQYDEAARLFKKSVEEEPAAGALLNLGLSEWRLGRNGLAVWSWQQAEWLDPFSKAAKDNLNYARESAQINVPELAWYEKASTWLPANWWAWLGGGSLFFTVAMLTLPGVLRLRRAGWHQACAAMGCAVFLLSVPPSIGSVTRANVGVVLEKNSPLLLTPTKEGEVILSLPEGEMVRELRSRGKYVFVRTQSAAGWVEGDQIGLVCPP